MAKVSRDSWCLCCICFQFYILFFAYIKLLHEPYIFNEHTSFTAISYLKSQVTTYTPKWLLPKKLWSYIQYINFFNVLEQEIEYKVKLTITLINDAKTWLYCTLAVVLYYYGFKKTHETISTQSRNYFNVAFNTFDLRALFYWV